MSDYKAPTNSYYIDPPSIWPHGSEQHVKEAEEQLAKAKAARKEQRKAERVAAKAERQRHADEALALDTLRDICEDVREYSADARVEAAKELLSRVA